MISGYGLENLILEQANLSKFVPLVPYYDHGWSLNDQMSRSIIENPSNEHFAWNKRQVKLHSKLNKKFYITGSPYIFYVDKYLIKKKQIKNTIFFLSHSTPKIRQEINFEELMVKLNSLPENLKPIDICLHYYDIKLKKMFNENGFKVRCSGKVNNNDYPSEFFKILTEYSFSCSNTLGSYVLYSLYLDIPFFLIGTEPLYDNFGLDKNVMRKYRVSEYKYSKNIFPLFRNFVSKITPEQKKMMEYELGLLDRIDNNLLRKVILDSLKQSLINPLKFKSLLRSLARTGFMKIKSLT